MSETYTLEAQARTLLGKQVKQLRRENIIPAIIYGVDTKPINISIPRRALDIVLAKAGATNVITITVDGKPHNTLVREVQREKIKRLIEHVDFLQIDLTKKLRTEVQIALVHYPKLSAELMVTHGLTTLLVECLPTNIPNQISVDISQLLVAGARLTVSDLPRLPDVTFLGDPHEVVVRIETIVGAPEDEEADAAAAAVASEPEVIEKGKKEEEEF